MKSPAPTAGLPVFEYQQGYADTWDVGGSRWPLWSSSAFDPDAYVGTTTVVPLAVLSAPPTYTQMGGLYGQVGDSPAMANAMANPWNPKHSPTPVVLVALALALYGIHYLYYKERRKR